MKTVQRKKNRAIPVVSAIPAKAVKPSNDSSDALSRFQTPQQARSGGGMEGVIARLEAVEKRNKKVSLNKAWETSFTRRLMVTLLTYAGACAMFVYIVPVANWWLAALVPTMGYVVSTLGMAMVRKVWERIFC